MNIEELKRLAEAATPGPWVSHPKGYYGAVCRADDQYDLVAVTHGQRRNNVLANEAYIAAANPAAVLELIAEVERVTKQRDELLAALKSYRVARAMPSYGDYASIQWESQQGPTNPQWGGGDCNKHGRWYGHCHCCANDWDKLKKQADQDAVHARDNALRKADSLAVEAISKAEG